MKIIEMVRSIFKSYSIKHLIYFLYYNDLKYIRVKLIIIKDFSKVQTFKPIIEKFRKFNSLMQPMQVWKPTSYTHILWFMIIIIVNAKIIHFRGHYHLSV